MAVVATGLRNRDHEVGVDGVLAGEAAPGLDAHGLHAAAGDRCVRAGQVDELEQASLRGRLREPVRAEPVRHR